MNADNPDLGTAKTLTCAHIDITGAADVDVSHSEDRTVLWVNVNGVCVLRICRIQHLSVKSTE